MLRALAVAALLAVAFPAEAARLGESFSDGRSLDADTGASFLDAPTGTPLLRHPPATWAPLLREHGYAQASQSADEPQAEGEDEEETVRHSFLPLGDVDGNGRADVILVTAEADVIRYEALEGGRPDSVLWSLQVDEDDSYAYLAGDVDEDGVYDLERVTDRAETRSDDGTTHEQRTDVAILSGRDLAQLTALQLVTRFTYEEQEPEPVFLVGTSSHRETVSYEYVMDLKDRPGLARHTWTFSYTQSQERYVVTTSQASTFNVSSSIAILDAAGALVWSFDEPGWSTSLGVVDATGDGVPDVLASRSDEFGFGSSPRFPLVDDLPADPPVPIPIVAPAESQREPFRLRLLDGTDGSVAWEQALGNASYSNQRWVGDVFGDGPVLAVVTADFMLGDYGFEEAFRTFLLDGADGTVLHTIDHELDLLPLGDANGDGRDDLLRADFNDSTLRFQAVDGEFTELWDLAIGDDEFAGLVDMTGDQVRDVLSVQDENVTVRTGTTGKEDWDRHEERLAFVDVTPGIVEETDRELALVLSDAEDHEDIADHPVDLLLLRGSDGAPLWRKPLYDPKDYLDASADSPYLTILTAGDVNGDGARDFLVHFGEMDFEVMMVCAGDGCEDEEEPEEDDGQPIAIAAIVDGATGESILRFDDMDLAPKVKKVEEAAVDVKPAAAELTEEPAPAPAALLALAAVGAALLLRRRRA